MEYTMFYMSSPDEEESPSDFFDFRGDFFDLDALGVFLEFASSVGSDLTSPFLPLGFFAGVTNPSLVSGASS